MARTGPGVRLLRSQPVAFCIGSKLGDGFLHTQRAKQPAPGARHVAEPGLHPFVQPENRGSEGLSLRIQTDHGASLCGQADRRDAARVGLGLCPHALAALADGVPVNLRRLLRPAGMR